LLLYREEYILRVFENRVLKRIMRPKWEAGDDCIIRSFITNIIRVILLRMRQMGHVARMRNEECIQYFGWKTRREKTFGNPRRRCEDNIRMDLKK
jgi:hypothetical protein